MYTAELRTTRTAEERQACEERATATRALIDRLLKKPRPVAPQAVHGPLHQAIIDGDLAGVRQHLSPFTVNKPTLSGLTPLHLGVYGYSAIAETAPWHTARAHGRKLDRESIVDILIEAGAKLDAWDHAKRLPAACCQTKRLPDSLVTAMDALIEKTTHGVNERKTLNAFFSHHDGAQEDKTGLHIDSVRR